MSEKGVIGLSGGVDSSVAAYLLQQQGMTVIGATIDTGLGACPAQDAALIARQLGMEHEVIDVKERFEQQVVRPFTDAYFEAKTPNPCVLCNPRVKWQSLLELADRVGARYVATGHYSRVVQLASGRYTIEKALYKDQSYVLYGLSQAQLSRTLMPLGDYTKEKVRQIAAELGLGSAEKADSQEICFIPDNNYARFITEYSGRTSPKGAFVTADGAVLGEHQGLIHYTIGQRKGLGIALGERAFVTKLKPETNEVVLGRNEDCFQSRVLVQQVNFVMEEKYHPGSSPALQGKIRYAHREAPCRLKELEDGLWECLFDAPQRAVTPGQAIVWYAGSLLYGGGIVKA